MEIRKMKADQYWGTPTGGYLGPIADNVISLKGRKLESW